MAVLETIQTKLRAQNPADKYVLWAVLLLCAIGIVAVYSAIAFLAATKADGDTERFLLRHLQRVGLGLAMVVIFSRIDYHKLARLGRFGLTVSLIVLLLVPVVGITSGGRSEEHTSELQSRGHLVCRLLLEN